MRRLFLLLYFFFFVSSGVRSQSRPLRIAVAANAQFVIKALQADFKKKTGLATEVIIGSSGNLATQVKNGAPYDLFLSADMHFPENLFNEGFGIAKPKEYALGSLVVCSSGKLALKNWRELLPTLQINKIALANPALAPYGKAAEQALRHYQLWDRIQSKLVFGESISQVNTYIVTGVVSMGFTTESLLYEYPGKDTLNWARVDERVYEKIKQGIIVLKYSRSGNLASAMKFFNYISSPAAKQIFKKYGYRVS